MSKKYKTKHNQTKKHKYYSNLILIRYVFKIVELIKFQDEFNPYFIPHTRRFTFFTIHLSLRLFEDEDIWNNQISVTNNVIYNIQREHFSIRTSELANDFLHRVISIHCSRSRKGSMKRIPEREIVFISDPKDITQNHYLEEPKSMLCRKLNRRFHESTPLDFEYNWLPDNFKDL